MVNPIFSSMYTLSKRRLLVIASILVVAAALFIFVFSNTSLSLVPTKTSQIPLHIEAVTDQIQGGDSSIVLKENPHSIIFDFTLSKNFEPPYANLNLLFDDLKNDGTFVDLSNYSQAIIKVRCKPRNELVFMLHVYENNVTQLDDITSFRKASSFFTCDEVWQEIQIDLDRLITPEWWLQTRGLSLSKQQYSLNKVKGISLVNSGQSPRNLKTSVYIDAITLKGVQFSWIVAGCMLLLVTLIFIPVALYLQHQSTRMNSRDFKTESNSLSSQAQLEIKSKRERELDSLLAYLVSNYSNAHISLEHTANELGLNRTKINQLLKEATGHTFSSYLNKLRLTEAARLLKEKQITVSEAAFAVGFGSISYFNRVFKKEFSCSPSQYRENDPSTT